MINIKTNNYESDWQAPDSFDLHPKLIVDWRPDIEEIKQLMQPYEQYKNIIVIGNGGSISTLEGYWQALGRHSEKTLTIVDTMEPDRLRDVMRCNPPEGRLVMAISKSGDTVGVIEAMLAFEDYHKLILTMPGRGAISQIAEKLDIPVLALPQIGGRFSGRSIAAYGAAHLLGIDIAAIEAGARSLIDELYNNNQALEIAKFIGTNAQKGTNEIYAPVYSSCLSGFNHLVTQLIHESAAKDGKGVTILTMAAPECQHHSNQRFFGGPRNMMGIITTLYDAEELISVSVPEAIQDISIGEGKVGDLARHDLQFAINAEATGTIGDAKEKGIPLLTIEIEKIDAAMVGSYVVIWQLVAIYLAQIFGVDPYNQPHVERSKDISFSERLN